MSNRDPYSDWYPAVVDLSFMVLVHTQEIVHSPSGSCSEIAAASRCRLRFLYLRSSG
jgi:hypothetical protein